jgi:ribose 5-phosphate isomerase B
MRTAIGSDERSELTDALIAELEKRSHEIVAFGPVANQEESDWPLVCGRVADIVASGEADEGIVCCWTGTGASIAANKVPGIRAALVHDAETARGACLEPRQRVSAEPPRDADPRDARNTGRLVRDALL